MDEFRLNWNANTLSEMITFEDTFTKEILYGYIWWCLLTLISLYNISTIVKQWKASFTFDVFQTKMLYLSTVYVFVCAIRAIWPRQHPDRICFINSWISYPFVGRLIATIAELCFVKQCSLVIREIIIRYDFKQYFCFFAGYKYYVPFIGIAEIFSWIGVATKCQIWNAFEESIWAITEMHMLACFILLYVNKKALSKYYGEIGRFLLVCIVGLCVLITFMWTVDVPMYARRYVIDTYENKVQYLSVYGGVFDLMQCKEVSHDFDVWKEEVPWMTGYFSFGVWLSIYLINISVVVDAKKNKKKQK